MIVGLAIEEWILPYHTVGMQRYNHLLPPTTVPAAAFLSCKLLQVLNWDTVWETSASGSVMWGPSLHRMVTDSVSYHPLPPAQESEPGWRLVLLCIPPPSRKTETLTSAAWILISFLQNSCLCCLSLVLGTELSSEVLSCCSQLSVCPQH